MPSRPGFDGTDAKGETPCVGAWAAAIAGEEYDDCGTTYKSKALLVFPSNVLIELADSFEPAATKKRVSPSSVS
jgi:hypothetical protein